MAQPLPAHVHEVSDLVADEALYVAYELLAPVERLPAATPFAVGGHFVNLLTRVAASDQRTRKPTKVDWRLARAVDGAATFVPTTELDLAQRVATNLVVGFGQAEHGPVIPPRWDIAAAKAAQRLANSLTFDRGGGMHLSASGTRMNRTVSSVITRHAGENLAQASAMTLTSYGSVTGSLGRVSTRPRRTASLWNDLDGRRIELRFSEEMTSVVRSAFAFDHVEVTGVLSENRAGQILRIDVDSLQVLSTDGPTWVDLPQGSYRNITGGKSIEDFLENARGDF